MIRTRHAASIITLFATLAVSAPAFAEDAASTTAADDAGRQHDGFQLRLGVGGGYLRDDMEADFFSSIDGKADGSSFAFQATAAWAVGERLFLGGGVFTETVTDPEITFEGNATNSTIEIGTLTVVGVYLDYYFDDNWHLFGALGGANIRTRDESGEVDPDTASGAGGLVGIGYDAWITDDFLLGGALRSTGGSLWGDFVNHQVSALSLLIVGTYD